MSNDENIAEAAATQAHQAAEQVRDLIQSKLSDLQISGHVTFITIKHEEGEAMSSVGNLNNLQLARIMINSIGMALDPGKTNPAAQLALQTLAQTASVLAAMSQVEPPHEPAGVSH